VSDTPPALSERDISLAAMLRCFTYIGLTGFGGVLPIVLHELVRRRRWLSQEEFAEILSVCQVLPGPNIINVAILFGMRAAGWRGAAVCVAGLLVLPLALVMVLASLYSAYSDIPQVQAATRAVAAGAAGLVSAMSLRLLWPLRHRPLALCVVVAGFVLIVVVRLPLVVVIAVLAPVSLGFSYWESRRAR
jgi:chromate transporter